MTDVFQQFGWVSMEKMAESSLTAGQSRVYVCSEKDKWEENKQVGQSDKKKGHALCS